MICHNECGSAWCCRHWLSVNELTADVVKLARLRGLTPYTLPGTDWRTSMIVLIPVTCNKLQDNLCSIYEKRPVLCRQFPMVEPRTSGLIILPDSCPFHGRNIVKMSELEELL